MVIVGLILLGMLLHLTRLLAAEVVSSWYGALWARQDPQRHKLPQCPGAIGDENQVIKGSYTLCDIYIYIILTYIDMCQVQSIRIISFRFWDALSQTLRFWLASYD